MTSRCAIAVAGACANHCREQGDPNLKPNFFSRLISSVLVVAAIVFVVSRSSDQATTPPSSLGPGCDGSYPTICIPSSSADLDCADVGRQNFPVVGSDPYGFDGDYDGVLSLIHI